MSADGLGNGWQWLIVVCLYWQCLAMSAGLPVLAVPSDVCWKSLCIGNGWQWLIVVCLNWQCLAMSAGGLSVLAMAGSG